MPLSNSIKHPVCFNPVTGRTDLSTWHSSIQESLKLLFLTSPGELLGDPAYGTNLVPLLYEPNDTALIDITKTNMVNAAITYEPRVTITHDDIQIGQYLNQLYVQVSYMIKNTGARDTLTLQVAIREGY